MSFNCLENFQPAPRNSVPNSFRQQQKKNKENISFHFANNSLLICQLKMFSTSSMVSLLTKNIDPITKTFPIFQGFPLITLTLVLIILIFIKVALPRWISRDKKVYDMRPGMLAVNGIDFGVSVVGPILILLSSPERPIGFSCQPLSTTHFAHVAYRYAGVAYFFVILTTLCRPIFRIFHRQTKGIDGFTLQTLSTAFFVYYILRFETIGAAIFLPLIETAVGSFRASYLILTTAPNRKMNYVSFRRVVIGLQIFQGFTLLYHAAWLVNHPNCSGYNGIKIWETVYGLGLIFYGLSNINKKVKPGYAIKKAN